MSTPSYLPPPVPEIKATDTHDIYFRVTDELTGLPFDLTGYTSVEVRVRRGRDAPIGLTVVPFGDPADGVLRHTLTGTLVPGSYTAVTVVVKDGRQYTAPTDDFECFTVSATIGVPA